MRKQKQASFLGFPTSWQNFQIAGYAAVICVRIICHIAFPFDPSVNCHDCSLSNARPYAKLPLASIYSRYIPSREDLHPS